MTGACRSVSSSLPPGGLRIIQSAHRQFTDIMINKTFVTQTIVYYCKGELIYIYICLSPKNVLDCLKRLVEIKLAYV